MRLQRVSVAGALSKRQARAAEIAARAPLTLRTGKGLFYDQPGLRPEHAYHVAGRVVTCTMDSQDARDSVDAFFDKRTPVWKGR